MTSFIEKIINVICLHTIDKKNEHNIIREALVINKMRKESIHNNLSVLSLEGLNKTANLGQAETQNKVVI